MYNAALYFGSCVTYFDAVLQFDSQKWRSRGAIGRPIRGPDGVEKVR